MKLLRESGRQKRGGGHKRLFLKRELWGFRRLEKMLRDRSWFLVPFGQQMVMCYGTPVDGSEITGEKDKWLGWTTMHADNHCTSSELFTRTHAITTQSQLEGDRETSEERRAQPIPSGSNRFAERTERFLPANYLVFILCIALKAS